MKKHPPAPEREATTSDNGRWVYRETRSLYMHSHLTNPLAFLRNENIPKFDVGVERYMIAISMGTRSEVKEFFDDNSIEYQRYGPKPHWETKKGYIKKYSSFGAVLDIGCGSGAFVDYLSNELGVRGYGFDISEGMLLDAQDQFGGGFFLADATSPPIPPESFGVVHMESVLHHIVGETRSESKRIAGEALQSALQLVKPGGLLVLTEVIYEGRLVEKATPYLIFYTLKYAPSIASVVDSDVIPGLSVSFYTRSELVEMANTSGGSVVEAEFEPPKKSTIPTTVLLKKFGRFHMCIKKPSR